jgi:hypothetical protein
MYRIASPATPGPEINPSRCAKWDKERQHTLDKVHKMKETVFMLLVHFGMPLCPRLLPFSSCRF